MRFHIASSRFDIPEKALRCGSGLVHLERYESASMRTKSSIFEHCRNCDHDFGTLVTSDEKALSFTETATPFFTSLLV